MAEEKENQPKCHIHDKIEEIAEKVRQVAIDQIHENVCVAEFYSPLLEHTDGKHYCLFHMPTKDKDTVKFDEIFQKRLESVQHNFRYVWFPSPINLLGYQFVVPTDFSGATFSQNTNLSRASFSASVSFHSVTFEDDVYFGYATFRHADFKMAIFTKSASFGYATFAEEASFISATFIGDASFHNTTFTETAPAYFRKAIFTQEAYFGAARFSAYVYFNSAKFSVGANFKQAIFAGHADFTKTKFAKIGATNFSESTFAKDTLFERTKFGSEVSFDSAIFGGDSDVFFLNAFFAKNANFRYCTAEGHLQFTDLRQGKENKFDFRDAAFERAYRISFHSTRLQPNWFVNVDSRKFVFTNCEWHAFGEKRVNLQKELAALVARQISKPHKLLRKTCKQLADNYEDNKGFVLASAFRLMAYESKRFQDGKKQFFRLYFLYWLFSRYGESWWWAALVLLGVLVFFGLLYWSPLSTFDYGWTSHKMDLGEGLVHSLYVAAFQRPEPKAADNLTKFFVILETIFAPLQAALLALAIRRKFMR